MFGVLTACTPPLAAQAYPDRLTRYIVPGSPGSGADVLARIVAGGLAQLSGQQVVVENRTGAGGNIGAEIAAKAPADGYTLLQISLTHALNVSLYRKLGYDLVRDFTPVTQIATSPQMVVVHPSLPVKSIGELVRLAKARPGAINYASAGTGTPTFLSAELFKARAGIDLLHVPYKGGGEAMTSVIAGETSLVFGSAGIVLPFVKQGRMRALAVTSTQRMALLPQLPTVAEAGYANFQSGNWYGVLVPAKTPKDMIGRIRDGVVAALNDGSVKKRLTDIAYVTIGDQPDQFAAFIKSEIIDLAKLVQQLKLSAD